MRSVVVVDAVRTPFGRMGGALKQFYMTDLAAFAVRGLIEKTGLSPTEIDAVYAGCALGDVHSNNIARYIALSAGLPYQTSAVFVEMQCGSAIACLNHAAFRILAEDADTIIVAGAESYSQMFAKFSMSVEPYKLIAPAAVPNHLAPVTEDSIPMVEISDRMAARWNITRESCDDYALRSQQLAKAAIEGGFLDGQITPVSIPATRKTPEFSIAVDEQPRPDTTLEGLARLSPVRCGGVTTAGNASGRNDGGAALLLMSEEKARALGLEPLARWNGGTDVGVDPKFMGIGPAFSNMKLIKQKGLRLRDIDVFECNEAFSAQNLSVIREMEEQSGERIDLEKWNPNGGAIAFGHPNGASGVRIAMFALRQMQLHGGHLSLISSCCGGGLGVSALLERI